MFGTTVGRHERSFCVPVIECQPMWSSSCFGIVYEYPYHSFVDTQVASSTRYRHDIYLRVQRTGIMWHCKSCTRHKRGFPASVSSVPARSRSCIKHHTNHALISQRPHRASHVMDGLLMLNKKDKILWKHVPAGTIVLPVTRWDNFVLDSEVICTHAHTEAERASCLPPRPSFWSTVPCTTLLSAADVHGDNQSALQ